MGKLAARADAQLGKDLAQVVLNGARLMNSCPPISLLDKPSWASRATCSSCGGQIDARDTGSGGALTG